MATDLQYIRDEMKRRKMSSATLKPTGAAPNPNVGLPEKTTVPNASANFNPAKTANAARANRINTMQPQAPTTPTLGQNFSPQNAANAARTSRIQGGQGGINNAAGQGATAIEAQGGVAKENFDSSKFLIPQSPDSPYRRANAPYRGNIEGKFLRDVGQSIGDVFTGKTDPIRDYLANKRITNTQSETPTPSPTPNRPVGLGTDTYDTDYGALDQSTDTPMNPQQTPLRKPGTFTSEEIRMRRLPNVEDVNRPAQNEFRGGGTFSVLPSRSDSTVEGNVAAIESAIQGEREMKAAKRAAQWQSLPENQRGRPPTDVAEYLGLSVTPRSNEIFDSSAGYTAELEAKKADMARRSEESLAASRIKNAMANVKRKDRADVLQQYMGDQQSERESLRSAATDQYTAMLDSQTARQRDAIAARGQELDYEASLAATQQRAQGDYLGAQMDMAEMERKVAADQANLGVDYANLDLNQRKYLLDQEKAASSRARQESQTSIEQQNANTRSREEQRLNQQKAIDVANSVSSMAPPQVKAQAYINAGLDPKNYLTKEEFLAFQEFQNQLGNY